MIFFNKVAEKYTTFVFISSMFQPIYLEMMWLGECYYIQINADKKLNNDPLNFPTKRAKIIHVYSSEWGDWKLIFISISDLIWRFCAVPVKGWNRTRGENSKLLLSVLFQFSHETKLLESSECPWIFNFVKKAFEIVPRFLLAL